MTPLFTRLRYAFRTFFSILIGDRVPDDVLAALTSLAAPAAAQAPAPTPRPDIAAEDGTAQAAQMLALLQRDGRLVDFLLEDIAPYADAQVGAAVRDVHAGCRSVLQRYLTLVPIIEQQEGDTIALEAPVDPGQIKIVGNAGGTPVRGVLRHRGWIARQIELPQVLPGGRLVIAPAEIDAP